MERKFRYIELYKATGNDSNYTSAIAKKLSFMDLILVDPGYFNAATFKEIVQKGAFFLSRVKTNTKYYADLLKRRGRHTRVDIIEMLKNSEGRLDCEIYKGRSVYDK